MSDGVNESQFYMWRTLFAVAHADNVVTDEEVRFMAEALEDIAFSEEQRTILNDDTKNAKDIEQMFFGISDVKDQAAFFKFARELVHIDGDYGAEEQAVMLKLKELHLRSANLDELVGSVSMELEAEEEPVSGDEGDGGGKKDFRERVYSFRDAFLKKRFKREG
ncbi:MAG: hypothetical protein R3E13_03540 [Alphaproteobacteria bacterium]